MTPRDPGLRLHVGVPKSGKTYLIQREVSEACLVMPVIVLDRMGEWTRVRVPRDVPIGGFSSVSEAGRFLYQKRRGLAVVRPAMGADPVVIANDACAWAVAFPGVAGVAFPEAHRIAPNGGRLPPAIDEACSAWRHRKVALWADTQRLPKLHKDITELAAASELRVFACFGEHDLSVLRGVGGNALVSAVRECGDFYARAEYGYHVRLYPGAAPPYPVVRA